MSDLPSPSKSPTPATLQLASVIVANTAPLESVAPFMSQIVFSPVARLCHRMSDLPSPLKSPTPAIPQLRSAIALMDVPAESVAPFMSQMVFSPVALLRHRMSDLRSLLKSLPTRRLTSVFTETGAVHAELFPAASKALTR